MAQCHYPVLSQSEDTWRALLLGYISGGTLLSKFTAGGVFNKGLPSSASLQSQALAHVFQVTLSQGFVLENDFPKAEHQEALDECFKNGWLHTERLELGATEGVPYFFASPLHRWFVQAQLGTAITAAAIRENNLIGFVILSHPPFSPDKSLEGLQYIQRPPEAQFQDEFVQYPDMECACRQHKRTIPT